MEKEAIKISNAQLRRVISAYDPKYRVQKITPVQQGVANPVFVVHSRSRDIVVRIFNPIAGDWKPKKESLVYELLSKEGIPAPEVLLTDISKKIIPYNYAISKRLSGKSLNDTTLRAAAKIKVMEQLGEYLGRMHSITFDCFGDIKKTPRGYAVDEAHELGVAKSINKGPFMTWKAMHKEIVNSRLHYVRGTEFAPLIPAIKKYFKDNEHLIDYNITPRLLHLDLNRGNIFVKGNTITGILDVEESLVGHNEYDLMRTENLFENNAMREAFFKKYTSHITLDNGYKERRAFYALSRSLAGVRSLVLWKTHLTKKQYEHERAKTRERIRNILANKSWNK